METTFMTIHNLSPEANILYASESIVDILGYNPEEVVGKSCFDYFHPEEVPFARNVHGRGVVMDKAAVLNYARIKNRDGMWVGCECIFTVVYEVLVACTSIYKGDLKNERRAVEAPAIRRLFASSPRDPRYHMLEHLSSKFRTPLEASLLEPRAALIINRFTRTLTVMYATNAVSQLLGISPEQLMNKSFYECMQENCLTDAIRCLESAKANDSIAYLRFWYRDPRRPEDFEDEEMREASQSSDSEDGGVEIGDGMDVDPKTGNRSTTSPENGDAASDAGVRIDRPSLTPRRTSSKESTTGDESASGIFDLEPPSRSCSSSLAQVRSENERPRQPSQQPVAPIELEAVVSCTSDGLVVVLRRAREPIPSFSQSIQPGGQANGLFAAPWGVDPIRPHQYQPDPVVPFQHGFNAPVNPVGGPPMDAFMESIRECTVFAWSVTGINGNIASYARGTPRGEAQPPSGLPVWDPRCQPSDDYLPPHNQAALKRAARNMGERPNEPPNNRKVPYDHSHQENLLRQQNGFNSAPMAANQGRPMNHTAVGPNRAYAYQPQMQPNYHDYEQAQGHGGWNGEAGYNNNAEAPPQNRPRGSQNPGEGEQGNRHHWY